jgi:hypothetical protein
MMAQANDRRARVPSIFCAVGLNLPVNTLGWTQFLVIITRQRNGCDYFTDPDANNYPALLPA